MYVAWCGYFYVLYLTRILYVAPGRVIHTTISPSDTEVNVTWNPPDQPNGVITGYVVVYSIYENNTLKMSEMLSDNIRSYLIDDLGKYMSSSVSL